ncbi:hypothetical protein [Saccharothrix coeruleofusca]|uniref:Mycothiol maleylpyruvate isomerase-like protein n=1 Tax=Saccharothrix coeruleofusca TaxID=33919 RepID=A0A918EFQ0_9PSEU|nr:hypothetical protein [Saccharothrix coeruleofusca]MBP2337092.1 hypothetical protein [Saccharothrix coeruleofusca]GGP67208.1 hypothetical protein GCM10010185_45090 [Saccharothrix coeruleofusca]
MTTVTADDLDTAVAHAEAVLSRGVAHDWAALPGVGEWSALRTAEHIGDCLLSYAGQLVIRPTSRYVRFEGVLARGASAADALEFVVAGGRILVSTVRTSPPEARAHHPAGTSDPAGFAAMGCVEVLVHGEDIARNLGLSLDPPRELCARVLARLFPDVDASGDPWRVLLWATDRSELPGRGRRGRWRWRSAVPGE